MCTPPPPPPWRSADNNFDCPRSLDTNLLMEHVMQLSATLSPPIPRLAIRLDSWSGLAGF